MAQLILYYADWCPHCQSFMPVWDKIRRVAPKYKIDAISYNDSTDHLIMKRDNITSFPTLIYINGGKRKEIMERTEEDIMEILEGGKKRTMTVQSGGSCKKRNSKKSAFLSSGETCRLGKSKIFKASKIDVKKKTSKKKSKKRTPQQRALGLSHRKRMSTVSPAVKSNNKGTNIKRKSKRSKK